jgi:hypothetical protein
LPSASVVSIAGSRLGNFIESSNCAKNRCLVPSKIESAAALASEFRYLRCRHRQSGSPPGHRAGWHG